MAERAVLAHLEKLIEDGAVTLHNDRYLPDVVKRDSAESQG
jgi:hypothetical protein